MDAANIAIANGEQGKNSANAEIRRRNDEPISTNKDPHVSLSIAKESGNKIQQETGEAHANNVEQRVDSSNAATAAAPASIPDEKVVDLYQKTSLLTYLELVEDGLQSLFYDGLESLLTFRDRDMSEGYPYQHSAACRWRQTRRGFAPVPEAQISSFDDHFYGPQFLRRWPDFAEDHAATFVMLSQTLGDEALFPPPYTIESSQLNMQMSSPGKYFVHPVDLPFYVKEVMEKPSQQLLDAYRRAQSDQLGGSAVGSSMAKLSLHGRPFGLEPQIEGDCDERMLPGNDGEASRNVDDRDRAGGPHRWGIAAQSDKSQIPVLIGEYNNGSGHPVKRLGQLMQDGNLDDFFQRVAKYKHWEKVTSDVDIDQIYNQSTWASNQQVVQMLCRNFHHMIATGIEYAYVATGGSAQFLRVPKGDWRTLYYHVCDFSVPLVYDTAARRNLNKGLRAPRETAAAYFASFCIWASQSTPRPASWINAAEKDLKRWLSHYEDDDSGRTCKLPRQPPVSVPWTIPYCTQACLGGMQRQEALDDKCPNVQLHREAATRRGAFRHPLTVDELRDRVVTQLAINADQDCECLGRHGLFGRHGVLFKITVTGYGYTFVAKGVRASDRDVLQHEERMYRIAEDVQGQIVPVFLGVIDLRQAVPLHSYVLVRHMMLLSYAGPDVQRALREGLLPPNIHLEPEGLRTQKDLRAEGVVNEHVRRPNMAWNDEAQRVMHFDLYRATSEYRSRGQAAREQDPHGQDLAKGVGDGTRCRAAGIIETEVGRVSRRQRCQGPRRIPNDVRRPESVWLKLDAGLGLREFILWMSLGHGWLFEQHLKCR
ncbi:uncharacterized protein SPSK_01482 [Sporothrix schenckii 1099-18]|uniref:Uncharacterized protein n=1 Tax=Sporothrix schenckii 1099-18 TaxID=1397361 RepID=A0A0F2MEP7_SPOSC|nr:uncharacterized protein SPSK_01482 [Sporothrix schenckii 1099-18]KJR87544.1 hypothetical protein SPSK_01482 [Sporothrix schenckii 1099-18]